MKYFRLWIRISLGVLIDMVSKYFFYNVKYLEDISLIRPTLNTGISWSLPVPFTIIIAISIVGIVGFIYLYTKQKLGYIATILLIWGTIGNLIDRIIYWWVRDFINIGIFNFPIFNFADILLSIWAWVWILQLILEKKK